MAEVGWGNQGSLILGNIIRLGVLWVRVSGNARCQDPGVRRRDSGLGQGQNLIRIRVKYSKPGSLDDIPLSQGSESVTGIETS